MPLLWQQNARQPALTLQLSEIRAELDRTAAEIGVDSQKLQLTFERSDFNLRCEVEEVSDSLLIDTIAIAKRHLENWRIHTFEKSFLSIQALNDNLFATEGLLEKIKIRISGLYGEKTLEITKKGALVHAELSLISAVAAPGARPCFGQRRSLTAR
jgi:hypothetical protein